MSTPTAPGTTFTTNERVLCYHGPLIYEAKVLKVKTFDEQDTVTGSVGPHYFVHYKGWKQTWDEWVPATRLLKMDEANLALQKQLRQANTTTTGTGGHGSSSKAAGKASGSTKDGGGISAAGGAGAGSTRAAGRKDGTRGTKRSREDDESNKKPEMKLDVPEELKVILVDDWEAVTKNNQLVTLNRSPTVEELLAEFSEYVLKNKPAHLRDPALLVPSITSSLQTFFDRSLGMNLLYRFERPQYAEVRKQYITGMHVETGTEKDMSQVYGAEHLLRMLVNMPTMVATSTLDPESVVLVRDYVNELLKWMFMERDRIFQKEYQNASLAYQNISRS